MTLQKTDLRHFTGSECFYRHPLTGFVYTEGVQYVANKGGAYWLLDKILTCQILPSLKGEGFQSWTLRVADDHTATLTCTDGNYRKLHREEIVYTDFPLEEIQFYFINRTLLLSSEY